MLFLQASTFLQCPDSLQSKIIFHHSLFIARENGLGEMGTIWKRRHHLAFCSLSVQTTMTVKCVLGSSQITAMSTQRDSTH